MFAATFPPESQRARKPCRTVIHMFLTVCRSCVLFFWSLRTPTAQSPAAGRAALQRSSDWSVLVCSGLLHGLTGTLFARMSSSHRHPATAAAASCLCAHRLPVTLSVNTSPKVANHLKRSPDPPGPPGPPGPTLVPLSSLRTSLIKSKRWRAPQKE